ncbi:hypothetical protein NKR23_g10647 [Pleurostoma richardsiae]|uniref:Uncharacterized protein n=1 Tax=Pleurostoma richardsiae TaxID=41990 RepID=A0AA38R9I2_9PEZI|nr:hypothetical protein NKR23_g10647 [Pleurostoma richardsiae]
MAQQSKNKQRGPPPSLFLHPSPAASHVSLPGILAPGASASTGSNTASGTTVQVPNSLHRTTSLLSPRDPGATSSPTEGRRASHAGQTLRGTTSIGLSGLPLPPLRTGESSRATDRTDALWAEMQATLEEVELSASGGTRVFGPDHDRKLAELRAAQIALAQAWARSEADDAIETTISGAAAAAAAAVPGSEKGVGAEGAGGKADTVGGGTDGGARSTAGTGSARPGSAGVGAERLGAKMEEETEVDILLARKRREANDRYFQRVGQGVLDVVAKLEEVSIAMRAVEQESKDIWGENDSAPSTPKT